MYILTRTVKTTKCYYVASEATKGYAVKGTSNIVTI